MRAKIAVADNRSTDYESHPASKQEIIILSPADLEHNKKESFMSGTSERRLCRFSANCLSATYNRAGN
jgi:hypothetical protein